MLHHMSLPAHDPARVAGVLAELTGGRSFPFPITPGAWMTVVGDAHGSAIEVLPDDTVWVPGEKEVETASRGPSVPLSGFHLALSVPLEEAEIQAIGLREGWLVRRCDRGPFDLIELWLENRFLVELLTPSMAPHYLAFLQPDTYGAWLEQVQGQAVAAAGARAEGA